MITKEQGRHPRPTARSVPREAFPRWAQSVCGEKEGLGLKIHFNWCAVHLVCAAGLCDLMMEAVANRQ